MQKAHKFGKDIYDMIRLYTDHAQDSEFHQVEEIFEQKDACKYSENS